MDQASRIRLADDFVRRFSAAVRAAQLYAPTHPLVQRAFDGLTESLNELLTDQPSLAVGVIGQEVIVGDIPLPRAADAVGELIRRLKALGIERIAFERGVTPEQVRAEYTQGQSIRRFVDPQEIADMCLFLASPAAKMVSGQAIAVDGHTETFHMGN